jgi:hypothetical protein
MNQDFVDLLDAFLRADVRFLVVGAYAFAVHARPRATGDLDVWIEPTAENAGRVMAALREFGAPLHQVTAQDFTQPDVVFQIGIAPRRIDILTGLTGLTFGEAWTDRTAHAIGPLEVPFLGLASLIRNKRATGRPQDLADLSYLEP